LAPQVTLAQKMWLTFINFTWMAYFISVNTVSKEPYLTVLPEIIYNGPNHYKLTIIGLFKIQLLSKIQADVFKSIK
jgi:hypothetical protein